MRHMARLYRMFSVTDVGVTYKNDTVNSTNTFCDVGGQKCFNEIFFSRNLSESQGIRANFCPNCETLTECEQIHYKYTHKKTGFDSWKDWCGRLKSKTSFALNRKQIIFFRN